LVETPKLPETNLHWNNLREITPSKITRKSFKNNDLRDLQGRLHNWIKNAHVPNLDKATELSKLTALPVKTLRGV